jgi:hypothetical protein
MKLWAIRISNIINNQLKAFHSNSCDIKFKRKLEKVKIFQTKYADIG